MCWCAPAQNFTGQREESNLWLNANKTHRPPGFFWEVVYKPVNAQAMFYYYLFSFPYLWFLPGLEHVIILLWERGGCLVQGRWTHGFYGFVIYAAKYY
jgi:hypothetical protein